MHRAGVFQADRRRGIGLMAMRMIMIAHGFSRRSAAARISQFEACFRARFKPVHGIHIAMCMPGHQLDKERARGVKHPIRPTASSLPEPESGAHHSPESGHPVTGTAPHLTSFTGETTYWRLALQLQIQRADQ
jgi:hypothetical protein